MLTIRQYVRAESLEQAYELNQKKANLILGGMHWMKMTTRSVDTAVDLSGLGLDTIVETDHTFEIGCMVTLRQLEQHPALNAWTNHAVADAVKDIVGVQFRNTATVGGSIFGRYGFSDVLTVFLALNATVVCHHAGEISLEQYAQMPAPTSPSSPVRSPAWMGCGRHPWVPAPTRRLWCETRRGCSVAVWMRPAPPDLETMWPGN